MTFTSHFVMPFSVKNLHGTSLTLIISEHVQYEVHGKNYYHDIFLIQCDHYPTQSKLIFACDTKQKNNRIFSTYRGRELGFNFIIIIIFCFHCFSIIIHCVSQFFEDKNCFSKKIKLMKNKFNMVEN